MLQKPNPWNLWCFLSLIVLVPHKDFPFMTLTQYLKSTGDFTSELKSLLCVLSTKYGHLECPYFSIWRNLSESLSSFSSRLTPKMKYQDKYSFVLDYFVEVIEQGERALHIRFLGPWRIKPFSLAHQDSCLRVSPLTWIPPGPSSLVGGSFPTLPS